MATIYSKKANCHFGARPSNGHNSAIFHSILTFFFLKMLVFSRRIEWWQNQSVISYVLDFEFWGEGKKQVELFLKSLLRFPKPSNRDTEISQKVHSFEHQTCYGRDLKFVMYLPCVIFHKFGVAIFKILIFSHFVAKKSNMAATFSQFFGHKLAKK